MLQPYLVKWIYFLIVFLLIIAHNLPAQQNKIDSLQHILLTLPKDTNRVKALNLLARQYINIEPEKVKFYAKQSLALALQLDYANGVAYSYYNFGAYHYVKVNPKEAHQYYLKSLEYYQKAGNQPGVATAYSNIGRIYREYSNYPKAMEYYLKAYKIGETIRDSNTIVSTSTSIGDLLTSQQRYDEALPYYLFSYNYYHRRAIKDYEALLLNYIGGLHVRAGRYKEAHTYTSQALALVDSLKLPRYQAYFNNSLGHVYEKLEQYDKGLTQYQKGLTISKEHKLIQPTVAAMQGIASISLITNKVSASIEYYTQSLQLSEEYDLKTEKLEAYSELAKAYAKQGDFKQAYENHSHWVSLKDSLFNEENTKKIADLQANYEIEKKQAQIELLQKDQQNAQLLRNGIAAGCIALLLIAGLIVSRQRLKIRKNHLLLEKSREVALKNEQLSQQAQKLKELDEAKSRFFANISHEFRTPLTLILNNLLDKIEWLKKQPHPPADELSQLQVMHRNAMRLLQLINQLLDLSKLESGQMKLALTDGDLTGLLHVIYASFDSLAHIRGIRFINELPHKPLLCRFDADMLEKMLYNLLSNAFKFTPNQGQIIFSAKLEDEEGKMPFLQISVQDSGPGMDAGQTSQVFNRFYQGKQYYSDEQGTGIGLALTKELVELHGGSIWVESEPGKGSLFTIRLPFVEMQGEPVSIEVNKTPDALVWKEKATGLADTDLSFKSNLAREAVSASKGEELPLVLLVEDNEDMRKYMHKHLQEHYRILESEDGLQGVEQAFETMPDLIISDYMMPGMDGIQLCGKLKADQRTSHIPVIMLTALATEDAKLKGLETGADDYLTKPFDSRELQLRIRNLIESRRKLRERFSRELHLEPASITVTSTDEKFLQKVIKIVEENMADYEFSMEDFGSEVGLSRMQLHRKLKALTGQTPGDFLRQMRLKRAAQLLQMQAGNVSEITYQVGFNNLSYFAKCFREQFGMAPTEYASSKAIQSI